MLISNPCQRATYQWRNRAKNLARNARATADRKFRELQEYEASCEAACEERMLEFYNY